MRLQKEASRPVKILLIEDSATDVVLTERLLKKSGMLYELMHISSAAEMRSALKNNQFDIVVSDYTLPSFGAPEALQILRQADPDVSFVVVSGAVGEEKAVELMRAGASDLLFKTALSRLPVVIDRELKEAAERRGRRQAEVDLQRSQADLKLALEQAHAASELKTSFLANMSHEIRTPIGAILGYTELASEVPVPMGSQLPNYLGAIQRNGEHLLSLIGDLLDITKIEADHLEIEEVPFDFKRELDSVLYTISPTAANKHIEFSTNFSSFPFQNVQSDPTRIKQILINVMGNALKFTDSGKVSVEVSQSEKEGYVTSRFLVKDSGIGLTANQAERLFEPFMQADTSTSRKFGGTGLGLALSRKLARHLGGDLQLVQSSLGEGSVFQISFRAKAASAEKKKASPVATTNVSLKGNKLLLVEDSIDNQIIVRHFLTASGIEIHIASNGVEALQKAKNYAYDIVLMDLQLPGIDGLQVTQQLRLIGVKCPILALTAHAFKGAREQALREGFSDYLTKPIDRNVLLTAVAKYLKQP